MFSTHNFGAILFFRNTSFQSLVVGPEEPGGPGRSHLESHTNTLGRSVGRSQIFIDIFYSNAFVISAHDVSSSSKL